MLARNYRLKTINYIFFLHKQQGKCHKVALRERILVMAGTNRNCEKEGLFHYDFVGKI